MVAWLASPAGPLADAGAGQELTPR
jgi:hypothetical protein